MTASPGISLFSWVEEAPRTARFSGLDGALVRREIDVEMKKPERAVL